MSRKRVMIIGPGKCGKTTLAHALNDCPGPARKTPDVIFGKNTIDVPGSYLENPGMYKHLIALAQEASHVLILVDQGNCADSYPPGLAKVFGCPVVGVITKTDLMMENEDVCRRKLKQLGVPEPYYKISFPAGEGISALKEFLFGPKQVKGGEDEVHNRG